MSINAVASQASGVTQDSATAASKAFTGNVTSGNRIVIVCVKGNPSHQAYTSGDCTKSAGTATLGAFTLDKAAQLDLTAGVGVWVDVGIWSAPVTGTGSCTIQISSNAGTYFVLGINEYHSSVGAISVDAGSNSASTLTPSAPNSGSVTPAAYDAVLVGGTGTGTTGADTHTIAAAWTQIYEEENGALHQTGSIGFRILTSGSDSASWTAPTDVGWVAAVAAYTESGGGGGATVALEWQQPVAQPTSHYTKSIIMAQSQTPQVVPWLVTKATFVTGTFDWILPTVDLDWTVG